MHGCNESEIGGQQLLTHVRTLSPLTDYKVDLCEVSSPGGIDLSWRLSWAKGGYFSTGKYTVVFPGGGHLCWRLAWEGG